MKAALQTRTQIQNRVFLVASILALSICVTGRPAAFAAGDASAAAAKETSEKKDKEKEADKDAKKEKSESSASKSTNGKSREQRERQGLATSSADSKSKATSTKHEPEKSAKGEKVRLAVLTLKDSLPETAEQAGPFGENKLDMREVFIRLDKAAKDKAISGMILDIQSPTIGRGKIDELRGAISRFRKSGKKVYAMLDSAEPSDYLVACACDEIVMPETGVVVLPGIHAEATFYRGLLAKVGVEADFIHIGDYKGSAEPFTRDKFSEPVRENMTKLIDDLYDDMVTTIVKDRPLTISQAKEIIDTGMITAESREGIGPDRSRRLSRYAARRAGQKISCGPARIREELRQKRGRYRFLRPDGILQTDASDDGRRIVVVGTQRQKDCRCLLPRSDHDRQERKRPLRRRNDGLDHDHRSASQSQRGQERRRDRAASR